MNSRPRLVADISGHGFGHVAITAPVLNCIGERRPDVEILVRSGAPWRLLAEHISVPFGRIESEFDFGMAMRDALTIDVADSYRRYCHLHDRWGEAVDAAAADLAELGPTLLLANVTYLSLAAAARAGVPAVALCCLNWADIFEHYCRQELRSSSILGQMRSAYQSAAVFLNPEPSMAMPWLPNRQSIGPIARRGQDIRDALRRRLNVGREVRLVLLSLGGVPFQIDVSRWPRLEGWHLIAAMDVIGHHPDVTSATGLGVSHVDLLASSCAVITKPGYGTVAEAAVNAVAVLYVSRDGWPEEACLMAWLRRHGRCAEIPREALAGGRFAMELASLLDKPAPLPPAASGADEAAQTLMTLL